MPDRNALIERSISAIENIRTEMTSISNSDLTENFHVTATYRLSAHNLLHYLALRRHDLRALQNQLTELGLSSLGRAEAHVMATINAVLTTLNALLGRTWSPQPELTAPTFSEGAQLLRKHTDLLLGPAPRERGVRIMVTMPSEAADDYMLVHNLLQRGMNCMRINCAHGDTAEWLRTIEHLRRAEKALGKSCKIIMDLAGPKLRTGPLQPGPAVLKIRPERDVFGKVVAPARVWLTPENSPHPPPSTASASLPISATWLSELARGEELAFADARNAERTLKIIDVSERGCWATLLKSAYLVPGIKLRRRNHHRDIAQNHGVVGSLPSLDNAITLHQGDRLILNSNLDIGRGATYDDCGQLLSPAIIGCTLPEVLRDVRTGERIWFDDGKIGGLIETVEADCVHVRITQARAGGDKLRSDKGINLPDSDLHLAALTTEDRDNLQFVVTHADMVALSFVNSPDDVELLQQEMLRISDKNIGLVLKIETQRGFYNLPEMVLAAMKSTLCGIMIARGDLAVECGFERLAEVQEEILWICEAAHMPVIWATQVLESLAKEGIPSRAEITDAAMANRAECVMLNKGPHIATAVTVLDDILRRMQTHHAKKSPMLRELKLAHKFLRQ
jgi:pyruvate kinase